MRQLTRKRMQTKFPLWKREMGYVWRKEGNLTLSVRWLDKGEYSATVFNTETQKYLFRQNDDVVSYAHGMTLLDGKIKKIITPTNEKA